MFALLFAIITSLFPVTVHAQIEGQCDVLGDLDCSDQVNLLDFNLMLSKFGTNDAVADLNNSGKVNAADIGILVSQFGKKALANEPTKIPAPTVLIPTSAPTPVGETQGVRTEIRSSSFGDLLR